MLYISFEFPKYFFFFIIKYAFISNLLKNRKILTQTKNRIHEKE